ncbi:hypothetical protein MKX01_020400 [Papaver californicum]|nr:hypothetical protein MKX01_020400 [Papaver californicum]
MECNKEESVRAKELAEKKMNSKDYVEAQRMIIKAQKLYPSIENISQMLTVCQVHCSAERKVLGLDPDWYGILQIEQTADEASIKKQFRKLALQLHPDKNKFPGAEAAFKLIKEAQRFLCDQSKRSQFDMKRKAMRPGQQSQSQNQPSRSNYRSKQPGIHSNPSSTGTEAQFKCMNPHQQKQQQTLPVYSKGTGPVYSNGLLWTTCPFCSIRYHRDIMDRALRCRRCMKPFVQGGRKIAPVNIPWSRDNVAPVNIPWSRDSVAPVSQPFTMSRRASVAGRAPKSIANEDVNVFVEAGKKGKSIPAEPKPPEEETDSFETGSNCDMEEDGDHKAGRNPGLNSGRDTRRSSRRKYDLKMYEGPEPVVVEVADPDFYDFDRDKSEECSALDKNEVACGEFKQEKTDTIEDIGTFSHKIVWEKGGKLGPSTRTGTNGVLIWKTTESMSEFVIILSDFTNESGILVTQLVKLKGFVCLFKPTKTNVLSFRTNGREGKDVPEGYFEFDPAAMPTEAVDGKTNGSLKSILEEKPHTLKNRTHPDEKSTFDGSSPGGNSSSRMPNVCYKYVNEENVVESKTLSTSAGVTAKPGRVSEQIPSSPSSSIYPCELPE